MKIWETIGLWHYPIPAYYLLAQFGLGFLVAMCNLVNNSVLLCIADQGQLTAYESVVEGEKTSGSEQTMLATVCSYDFQCLNIYSLLASYDEIDHTGGGREKANNKNI